MLSANATFLTLRLSPLFSSSLLSSSSPLLSPFVSPAVLKSSSDSRRLSFLSCSTLRTFSSFLSVYGSSVSRLDIVRGDFVSSLSSVIQIHSNEVSELHLSTQIIDNAVVYSRASAFVHFCTFRNINAISFRYNNFKGSLTVRNCIFEHCYQGMSSNANTAMLDSICMTRNYATSYACFILNSTEGTYLTNLLSFNCISTNINEGDDLSMLFNKVKEVKYVNNTKCASYDSSFAMLYAVTSPSHLAYINCVNTTGNRCLEQSNGVGLSTVEYCNFLNNILRGQVIAIGSLQTHLHCCSFFGNTVITFNRAESITCDEVYADNAIAFEGVLITSSTTTFATPPHIPVRCSFTALFSNPHQPNSKYNRLILSVLVLLE